jgi:hypothetical protein
MTTDKDMKRAEAFFHECSSCGGTSGNRSKCIQCDGDGHTKPEVDDIATLIADVRNEALEDLCVEVCKRKNEALKEMKLADSISAVAHHYEFTESLIRSLKSKKETTE